MTLKEYMHAVENRPDYWNFERVEVYVAHDARFGHDKPMILTPWEIPKTSYLWKADVAWAITPRFKQKELWIYIHDYDDPYHPHGWGHDYPDSIKFI